MTYCTLSDIERAVTTAMALRLLDDDHDGVADASAVEALLADVDGEIDGYAGRNYDLTTLKANPPAPLRRVAADVAVQFAYQRRPEFFSERGETPWEARYKRALRKLEDLRDGRWRLDVDGAPADPAQVDGGVYYGPSDTYPDGVGCGVFGSGFHDFL